MQSEDTGNFEQDDPVTDMAFSSSSDEAVVPSTPSVMDNFKTFQDLLKWMANTMEIPLEVVQEKSYNAH